MGVTDFLFEGKPPPQIESFASTSSNLPDWYSGFLRGNAAKANSIAGADFQNYVDASGNPIPRLSPFTADQTTAFANTRSESGAAKPGLTAASTLATTAGQANPFAAAQPIIEGALGRSSQAAAQPLLSQAAGTFPGSVDQYMSPYMAQVTDRIAELGNRNLTENILPGIQDQFIGAGQAGSSRQSEFGSRAIRDTANEIAGQQASALNQGYTSAGNLFNADQNRLAQLGQTTGQLATADTSSMEDLAKTTGALTSDTASKQLAAAQQLGQTGLDTQMAGLKGAAALQSVGETQQANQQQSLNQAYADFIEQRDYPQKQVQFMSDILHGMQPVVDGKTSVTNAPATVFGASPLAQIAGVGSGIGALASAFKGPTAAKGGYIQFASGGRVDGGQLRMRDADVAREYDRYRRHEESGAITEGWSSPEEAASYANSPEGRALIEAGQQLLRRDSALPPTWWEDIQETVPQYRGYLGYARGGRAPPPQRRGGALTMRSHHG